MGPHVIVLWDFFSNRRSLRYHVTNVDLRWPTSPNNLWPTQKTIGNPVYLISLILLPLNLWQILHRELTSSVYGLEHRNLFLAMQVFICQSFSSTFCSSCLSSLWNLWCFNSYSMEKLMERPPNVAKLQQLQRCNFVSKKRNAMMKSLQQNEILGITLASWNTLNLTRNTTEWPVTTSSAKLIEITEEKKLHRGLREFLKRRLPLL